MNGVIVLNKPTGKTSHDMVYFIRRLTGIRRVGHTGTLDPDATGVLPICIGVATKAAEYITDGRKKYRAQLVLGSSTSTQDKSGEIIQCADVTVTSEQICEAMHRFTGIIQQIPPMYSAVKVGGKKLYELARAGVEIERKSREIEVYAIALVEYNEAERIAVIDVTCSKGTYIRTLCNDIGESLGCFAHMGELCRLESGRYKIEDSYTTEELVRLADEGRLADVLIGLEDIFADHDMVTVSGKDEFMVRNGTAPDIVGCEDGQMLRVHARDGEFLCLSKVTEGKLKMQKSFWEVRS